MRIAALGSLAATSLAAALLAGAPASAGESPAPKLRQFGGGLPVVAAELPPSALRTRLERLPAHARARAFATLATLRFHEREVDSLIVDGDGAVAYACFERAPQAAAAIASPAPATAAASVPVANPPIYHSRPGSKNVAYLDFNGHVITGTAWNSGAKASIPALAFDLDGDRSTFSDAEQTAIREIWQRVAEDYAPFDLDITTQEPATWTATTGRILVTAHIDADGAPMPSSTAGGVSYVNTFGGSSFAYYSPSLVYYDNLASREDYIAEASAHEFGHALGLSHDGTTTGSAYFGGMGSGPTSWGPIMGTGYNENVSQWSKGEYPNANNQQDDLAIIAAKVGYRPDDAGDTIATAATATLVGNGAFSIAGVIGATADVDVYALKVGAGPITVSARSFHVGEHTSGGDLDIHLWLTNAAGTVIADANPSGQVDASLSATVAAGTYYVWIDGVGDPVTGYSDYASLGQYAITGTAAVGGTTVVIGNGTGLTAQYWTNQLATFSGAPALTRTDAAVNFDWGNGSPAPGVSADRFTARWTGQVQAETTETYTFTTTGDDGVRLWVNGTLLVDAWYDQGPTDHSGSIALTAGQKASIQMDFYENAGGATAKLGWSTPTIARQIVPTTQLYPAAVVGTGTGLTGQYWSNQLATFTGAPTLTRTDATVDFDWSAGSPAASVTADHFSARWTGQVQATTTETYTFTTTGDDGVRLWVNGTLLVDAWYDQGPTDHGGSIALTAGQKVAIQMDFYENGGGAVARLGWSTPTIARQTVPSTALYPAAAASGGTGLTAQYWTNQLGTFTGAPAVSRIDGTVDFDWGAGSPDPAVSVDRFTARWTGTVQAPTTEAYTFTVTGDDGVRLWVNGTLVVDSWADQPPTDHSGSIALTAGVPVSIQLDYYENGGGAVARLSWATPSMARAIVPQSALYPASPTLPTGITRAERPAADAGDDAAVDRSPMTIVVAIRDRDGRSGD